VAFIGASSPTCAAPRDREGKSSEPHLGLGLYVARLIAEFHGGAISAKNLASGDGVAVTASFRSA